jgi:hypothetical protein
MLIRAILLSRRYRKAGSTRSPNKRTVAGGPPSVNRQMK